MSTVEFKQRFTLGTVRKMLLDAAHDAAAIYLPLDHQKIEPFIDLNNRSKKNTATDSDIQISLTGIPICPMGKEMRPNGYDKSQNRRKCDSEKWKLVYKRRTWMLGTFTKKASGVT